MMNPRQWNFDIDRYLNPLVPSPPWDYIPYPIAHFLGHREESKNAKPAANGNLEPTFWALIGAFCSLILIEGVNMNVPSFESRSAPLIVGSFGATAVLQFYAIESPLAQPRNVLFGHFFSSLVGVCVQKLFLLSDDFDRIRWLGGALACAAATSVMALTKTVHPPAGATALLALVDYEIVNLGWYYLPVMILGCVLMTTVALLINNVRRRFPVYWWTPADLRRRPSEEKASGEAKTSSQTDAHASEDESKDVESDAGLGAPAAGEAVIIIRKGYVEMPEGMWLGEDERGLLQRVSQRL